MTGTEFRQKRIERGIPQDMLSKKLGKGFDRSKLSRFENGWIDLSPEELKQLCGALDELIALKQRARVAAAKTGWPAGL